MDFPFLHLYLFSTLFTTLAFLYIIFRFFVTGSNKTFTEQLPSQDIECLNDNIFGLINDFTLTQNQETNQKCKDSSVLTSTAKKIINNRKQRNQSNSITHRQCYFLPGSDLGLMQMKLLNKKYVKESEKAGVLGLVKQKKKKNLSNWVKKYGFHKTALVTIYEQLQY